MNTFRANFCAEHRCPPSAFARKVLWRTLPLPLIPFAGIWSLVDRNGLTADLRLIEYCGDARDSNAVRDEIAGYFSEAFGWSFWRRRCHFRISTLKLKRLARRYVPASDKAERDTLGDFLALV